MERFTQRARRVLSLAHEEAEKLNHNHIGTEHLLLGLIREEGGVAGRVLRELGLAPARVKDVVERLTGVGRHKGGRIVLAPGTEQVLQIAIEEARRMGHHYIGTEHLLLGLVHRGEGVGIDVLRKLGITPEQIRRQTRRILQESPTRRTARQAGATRKEQETKTPLVDQLATDLTLLAEEKKLDPVIGR
ncbi:MAG: NDP-hexose 4-ketoreductase, partial [Anaerolineales bacterium]|nr:NDP-hexose 4-ketoreductase [Anaerolineales bacterium]